MSFEQLDGSPSLDTTQQEAVVSVLWGLKMNSTTRWSWNLSMSCAGQPNLTCLPQVTQHFTSGLFSPSQVGIPLASVLLPAESRAELLSISLHINSKATGSVPNTACPATSSLDFGRVNFVLETACERQEHGNSLIFRILSTRQWVVILACRRHGKLLILVSRILLIRSSYQ